MLVVGAAAFCALGLAISSVIPNADASPPIVNAIILPLLFLSGIFIPLGNNPPAWMAWVGRIFPVKHFLAGMQAGFLGSPFHWTDVLVVAAWGLAGLLLRRPVLPLGTPNRLTASLPLTNSAAGSACGTIARPWRTSVHTYRRTAVRATDTLSREYSATLSVCPGREHLTPREVEPRWGLRSLSSRHSSQVSRDIVRT